ncbi:hypothetical protein MN116_009070, partial [Schistosoma mekongi]
RQSFSRTYGSNLCPTSLPPLLKKQLPRCWSPWRPAADMYGPATKLYVPTTDFQGPTIPFRHHKKLCFTELVPLSPDKPIPGKRNSSQTLADSPSRCVPRWVHADKKCPNHTPSPWT